MFQKLSKSYFFVNEILTSILFSMWVRIFREPQYRKKLTYPFSANETILFAANHQTLLDTQVIFYGLRLRELLHIFPVKFMMWHEYYNTLYKPILFSVGCYPSHGPGRSGLQGAYSSLDKGYSSYIYPEGMRTDPEKRGKAFTGIVKMLEYSPNARLILIHIHWEPRKHLLSRPKVTISMRDAPENIDRSDPDAIMDAIYET